MSLEVTKGLAFVDKIIEVFSDTVGKEFSFVEKQVALEHMGWFRIIYKYHPLGYDIVVENERGFFSIEISNHEGAFNYLYRIEEYDNVTTVGNVQNAARILKKVLQKNDFCFYIIRDEKLYRKENQQYKRIKDLNKLL